MADYISREAALDAVDVCNLHRGIIDALKSIISDIPAADVVPLPKGHGRLVDAREVLEKADKASWFDGDVSELGLLLGSEVTTIVPAEECSEE